MHTAHSCHNIVNGYYSQLGNVACDSAQAIGYHSQLGNVTCDQSIIWQNKSKICEICGQGSLKLRSRKC